MSCVALMVVPQPTPERVWIDWNCGCGALMATRLVPVDEVQDYVLRIADAEIAGNVISNNETGKSCDACWLESEQYFDALAAAGPSY